jgi:hypothetical protein
LAKAVYEFMDIEKQQDKFNCENWLLKI